MISYPFFLECSTSPSQFYFSHELLKLIKCLQLFFKELNSLDLLCLLSATIFLPSFLYSHVSPGVNSLEFHTFPSTPVLVVWFLCLLSLKIIYFLYLRSFCGQLPVVILYDCLAAITTITSFLSSHSFYSQLKFTLSVGH